MSVIDKLNDLGAPQKRPETKKAEVPVAPRLQPSTPAAETVAKLPQVGDEVSIGGRKGVVAAARKHASGASEVELFGRWFPLSELDA